MFAVMLLTGRALEVHVTDGGCNLAESAAVLGRALASVRVDAVHALSSILTHMFSALVNILGAIITGEPWGTFAFEVRKVIHAVPAILASVWRLGAKWNFCLAVLTLKTIGTRAAICSDFVDASCVVDALVIHAVVVVHLAAEP